MKLQITGVQNPNQNDDKVEKIFFKAKKGAELSDYLLYDSTFTNDETPSDKGRHVYRFPTFSVKQDCTIVLRIAKGPRKGLPLEDGGHRFYWNRSSPIINNTGDRITLVQIDDEQVFNVPAVK